MRIIWLLAIFIFWSSTSFAREVPEDIAVRVLVAEAANQGEKGMICVGEVLRRRGNPKGFRVYDKEKYKKLPKYVQYRAQKAWRASAATHYTNGADHFANIKHFKAPAWVKNCVKTYEYKDHVFFREVKRR